MPAVDAEVEQASERLWNSLKKKQGREGMAQSQRDCALLVSKGQLIAKAIVHSEGNDGCSRGGWKEVARCFLQNPTKADMAWDILQERSGGWEHGTKTTGEPSHKYVPLKRANVPV